MPVLDAEPIERACGVLRASKREERLIGTNGQCSGNPQYIGRMILLCGRKDGIFPFQCLVGPDWPCMLITYTMVCVPSIFFLILVAPRVSSVIVWVGLASFMLTLFFFSLTACSDPGIVFWQLSNGGEERSIDPESGTVVLHNNDCGNGSISATLPVVDQSTSLAASSQGFSSARNPVPQIPCSRCELSRPMGASHCYECEVCVKDLDHHCPWTGKCIGRKNLQFFYLFLTFLTVHIIFLGSVTAMTAINNTFHKGERL